MYFELARQIIRRLGSTASAYDEIHTFRYLDNQDPLSFVGSTENPWGQAAAAVMFIDEGAWMGGSYIIE